MLTTRFIIVEIVIGIVTGILTTALTQNIILGISILFGLPAAGLVIYLGISYRKVRCRGGVLNIYRRQRDCEDLIFDKLITSHRVMILAVQAFHIIRPDIAPFYQALVKRGGRKGSPIRMLLLDPEGRSYIARRAQEIGEPEHDFMQYITESVELARKLRDDHKVDLQVKLYQMLPVWQLFIFDDFLLVSFYFPGVERHREPFYQISEGTPLYSSYVRFFNHLWELAREPD